MGLKQRDLTGLAVVAGVTAAIVAYRAWFIEPREWGAVCAAAVRPSACLPRVGLLWLQQHYWLGAAALACGLWAFLRGGARMRVAAVALGVVGVANYNATWAMVGGALGAWCWAEAALAPLPVPRGGGL